MIKKNSVKGDISIADANWNMFQWKIPSWMKPVIVQTWADFSWAEKKDRRTLFMKSCNQDEVGKIYEDFKIIPKEES